MGAGCCPKCLDNPESLIEACIIEVETINTNFARYFNTDALGGKSTGNPHHSLSNLTKALQQVKEMCKQPQQLTGETNEHQNDA